MKIGTRLPDLGSNVSVEGLTTVARWAQELGYHSVWVGDHVLVPTDAAKISAGLQPTEGMRYANLVTQYLFDALTSLTWAASIAPDVQVGTSVLVLPLRNPALLAKQAAILDLLSGGRLILGLGVGWMKAEFDLVGMPFAGRGKRSDEMTALMRKLWTGEVVDFADQDGNVTGGVMQPPPAQPKIPIVWGGQTDAALRRVARLGDGWNPIAQTPDQLAAGMERIRVLRQEYGLAPQGFDVIPAFRQRGPTATHTGFQLTAAVFKELEAIGIDHVIVGTDISMPLPDIYTDMRGFAELCELTPRPAR